MKASAKLAEFLMAKVNTDERRNLFRQVAARGGGPRMTAAWAMRTLCPGLSFPSIANRLGYSDHTSALHAYARMEEARLYSPGYLELTDELLRDARAVVGAVIDQINNLTKPKPPAEELQAIMDEVRRSANRLDKAVERLNTYLEQADAG